MIQQLFSVYDSKARAFLVPFCCPHIDVALRVFEGAANTPGHQLHDYAPDFILFHVGTWDDNTCTFDLFPEHRNLGLAANFKKGAASVQHKVS